MEESFNYINFIVSNFDTIFPSIITILGFIVTYFLTKNNFKNEVIKNKREAANQLIKDLPYRICQFMNEIDLKEEEPSVKEYQEILSTIIAYGSKDSVNIAVHMQTLAYETNGNTTGETGYKQLALFSLLITQIKFDLTSEIISPESWLILKINDYGKIKAKIIPIINKLVKELRLNQKFEIK